jgi:hypothetical protein
MNKIIFFLWGLIILNQAVAQSDIKKFVIKIIKKLLKYTFIKPDQQVVMLCRILKISG